MKKLIFLTLFTSLLLANNYAVVANSMFKNLSKADIKAIYLKKLSYINNKKVIPINLSSRDKIRKSFEKNVLNMSFPRLKAYWTKQHYLGHRPPITMKSQESIKLFIQKIDSAVGYMEIKNVTNNLKILYKWSD